MFEFIQSAYGEVEQTRDVLQKLCLSDSTLLKPWPSQEASEKGNVSDAQKYKTICGAESEEVRAMSKLLAKADRTLTLLKQKSESHLSMRKVLGQHSQKSASAGASPATGSDSVLSSPVCIDIDVEGGDTTDPASLEQTSIDQTPIEASCLDNPKAGNIERENFGSSDSLMGRSAENTPKTGSDFKDDDPDVLHRSESVSLTDNAGVISQSKLTRLISQPHSSHAVSKKYRPAHTTAPFKTKAEVPKLKRPPSGSTKRKTSNLVRQSHLHKQSGELQRGVKICDKGSRNVKSRSLDSPRTIPTELTTVVNLSDKQTHSTAVVRKESHVYETDKSVNELKEKVHELKEAKCNDEIITYKKLFTLENDGHSLTVPPRLKHLTTKNHRLQYALDIFLSEEPQELTTPAAATFLQQYYNSMDVESPGIFRHRVEVNTRSYKTLFDILHNLHLKRISESSSIEDVCRARVLLEFILNTFHELNEESRQLLAECKQKKYDQDPNYDKDDQTTDKPHGGKHGFYVFGDTPKTTEHIRYIKERHIHEYWDLWHQYHILRINLHMLDLIQTEYIPKLRDLHGSDGFIPVYRSLYSLISPQRHAFPTFIKDTSESDEDATVV